jgi:heme A synthase
MKLTRYARFAWFVLAFNVAVVLWGAFVRASSSGAGCGSHWPLCNGEVIPVAPKIETIIEFIHRTSSGLSVIFIVSLLIWAFRTFGKGHPVRTGAVLSMFFILTEAVVGAGLVLFGWVAQNASIIPTAIHLLNTFLLLASLTLTAWWASGGEKIELKGQGLALWGLGIGFLGVLLLGVTGAITALGDTLFPSASLAEGLQQDFSSTANFLIRLRFWHPVLAIMVGFYLIFASSLLALFRHKAEIKRFVIIFSTLFVLQLCVGLINVVLLAPTWVQLIHLFLADSIWITLVLLGAEVFAQVQPGSQVEVQAQAVGLPSPQGSQSI